jgi:hypothetical protein
MMARADMESADAAAPIAASGKREAVGRVVIPESQAGEWDHA